MFHFVFFQCRSPTETCHTVGIVAGVGRLSRMYPLVSLEIVLSREGLMTPDVFTNIPTLLSLSLHGESPDSQRSRRW